MQNVKEITETLGAIYAKLDTLTQLLMPYAPLMKALGSKDIRECGATDKIKLAKGILEAVGHEDPNSRFTSLSAK